MQKAKAEQLIAKFITKSISANELELLSKWLENKDNEQLFYEYVKLNYAVDYSMSSFSKEKAKLLFLTNIEKDLDASKSRKFKIPRFLKYAAAAVILLLVSLPFIVKKSDFSTPTEPTIVSQAPILPGSDKAILTLEDGKHVSLEKGKKYTNNNIESDGENLFYSDVAKSEHKEIAYNYLTIPRGGQFFVNLSDGTKVWLNSESKLKYPVKFTKGDTRQVELIYGEAYFDVSPSKDHGGSQFKVNTRTQDVIVLGTEFNISSYSDEDEMFTTLVEGSVEVDNGVYNEILAPGQQTIINIKNDQLDLRNVDVSYYTAWKNGAFIFNKEPLGKMMKTLSRWYDVNVVFEDETKQNIVFSGYLNRGDSVNELLNYLEKTDEVEFEITDGTITVK